MNYLKVGLISVVIFFNFLLVLSQEGNSCITPDRKTGKCISIYSCSALLSLLKDNVNQTTRNFLRSSMCGVLGDTPLVCCPQETTRIPQTSQTLSKLPKSPDCGYSNVTIPRIVNGVPAKLGEFPWIVALGYRNSKNPALPKWLCGASLITNQHVLTAAHCVFNRDDLYLAHIGDLDLFGDDDGAKPSTIEITKIKIHEGFNPAKYANDIAVLTLKEAVNNPTIRPICLPVDKPYRSMSFLNFSPVLAGWGSVSFRGPQSFLLQEIFVPVIDTQHCSRVFSQRAIIDDKVMCAGSMNGDKDACGGDSGGPLMHQVNEGQNFRVYQIGIVSYGFKCAEPGYPGVYTRITAFVDWIEKNLN